MTLNISNSQIIGIDLGTTNSVSAYLDDTGRPKIPPNLEGDLMTPSVVHITPGCEEIIVGKPALNMMWVEPKRTLKECKRDVGTNIVYWSENGVEITPEWIQGEILKYMRRSAIEYFGDKRAASKAVITVPAYFNDKQRQSVMRSADLAGIEVLHLINEPTSAGVAFGLNEHQEEKLVAIPDLGGGTFDISLVLFGVGKVEVRATNGDRKLGGKDVDDILLKWVQEEFEKQHGIQLSPETHPAEWYTIWETLIKQKELLSSKNEVKFFLRAEGKQLMLTLDRLVFSRMIQEVIDRAEQIIRTTFQEAKMNVEEIQQVLPVGGSSRLVAFKEMIKGIFGPESIIGGKISPDLAVAEGAALDAIKAVSETSATVTDHETLKRIPMPIVKHIDCMSHSLGVAVQDPVSGVLSCSVILPKNTPTPCEATKLYASVTAEQKEFKTFVLQGEDDQLMEQCLVVGERILHLPARSADEKSIEITMGYGDSQLVQVKARDLVSGKIEDITVEHYKRK